MMRRGFTVIELVIVITIMGILLTLAIVTLNSSQANARDAERKSDAEALAVALESYYRNASISSTVTPGTYFGHTYPGAVVFINTDNIRNAFPDLDPKVYRSPNSPGGSELSIVTVETTTEGLWPSANNDVYSYEPLSASGTHCSNPTEAAPCRSFNIHYYQETTDSVVTITSKNQQ